MTDQEFKELYQYAKLGKALRDVIDKSEDCSTSGICTGRFNFNDDDICQGCECYELCKLLWEVDK